MQTRLNYGIDIDLQEWQVAISVADDIWSIKRDRWFEGIAQSTGLW